MMSGIEVCRRVRKFSDIPIIMLTAKDDISDKVTDFDSGADDYVTKPLAIEEPLARIRVAPKARRRKGEQRGHHNVGSWCSEDADRVTYDGEEILRRRNTTFSISWKQRDQLGQGKTH